MMQQHKTYLRIHVDGFAEGPVPEEVYGDVVGANGPAIIQARQYGKEIFKLIDTIESSRSGKIFLRHLDNVGGNNGIVIMPASLFPTTNHGRLQNATWPTRKKDSYEKGNTVRGSTHLGTGQGSPVKISFQLRGGNHCSVFGNKDEVLLHELVHATRATTGTQRNIQMRNYDRFEEFLAITITNIYRSERRLPLRDGHGCDRMVEDIAGFRHTYRLHLARLKQDVKNEALYRNLGAIPASLVSWNPFRKDS